MAQSFLSSMNITASGLTAQRYRMDIISQNVANISTTRTEAGEVYRRKVVVMQTRENRYDQNRFSDIFDRAFRDGGLFSSGNGLFSGERQENRANGVRVTEVVDDTRAPKAVYDPDHPDADENGYYYMANIDMIKEMTDIMAASRSYEANVTAFNAVKSMSTKALEIGR